jgi:hypothetical protein
MKRVTAFILGLLTLMVGFIGLGYGEVKEPPVIEAIRTTEPIKIDGLLTETVWQGKDCSDFIQAEPQDGAPATEKTSVWVAYDNNALYVAARLYDSEPDKIISLLGRRDQSIDSDSFLFSIDPYLDLRSGYQFAVNTAGTMVDYSIFNDESTDITWDGVWESKTHIDDKGWTVEMKIPFDQLRFKKKENYVWGVHFCRLIKRKNEWSSNVWIPKGESGFVSHFARLEGINNINPGRYIEMMPFTAGKAAFSPKEEGNPFKTGKDYSLNAGLDMRVGLKSNLTLDLTVNPDFGQVEVDPAVINLSAAETYYEEKRPFFMEGANIFRFGGGGANMNIGADWSTPSFFYSRRIGRSPQGTVNSPGYANYPEWTTILTAAKITGRIGKEWNFGFISALTEREYADIDLDGGRSREEIEPFSYYGVLRAQKEFNNGRQGLGFLATSVVRDLGTDSLEDHLSRNAFSLGIDGWTFLDKNKTWVVTGWFGGSRVSGSRAAIRELQLSFPHYFQRPDATHVELNENATSLNGWAGRFILNKQRGNFLVNAALGAISPGFDSSDMGYQRRGDIINGHIMLGYRSFKPGKLVRTWDALFFTQRNYDFGGNKIGEQRIIFIGDIEFVNYWSAYFQISNNPARWSKDETRGGPLLYVPTYTWWDWTIRSDDRKPFEGKIYSYSMNVKSGSKSRTISVVLKWKPRSNFNISLEPEYQYNLDVSQWVSNITDESMTATYGNRYIFGKIKQKTFLCSIRFDWIFTSTLSLQAYIQPFIAVGTYDRFKELAQPKSYDFNFFGQGGSTISYQEGDGNYTVDPDGPGAAPSFSFHNPDFNYKSLRGTVVLRWEYRPGSTLYLVWTQNRADFSDPGDFKFGRDFKNLLKAPGDNIFMLKLTYRFKL